MKRILPIILAVFLLMCMMGCRAETVSSSIDFVCDTVASIRAYAPQSTVDDAMRLARAYERVLSKTIEGSDVWNLNHADGQPVEVDPETAELLRLAIEIAEFSDGAFDITVAPYTVLWDFTAETPEVPDAKMLAEAAARVDYHNVIIDGKTVMLQNGAQIDLGGIAKGFIADRVADYLKEQGVAHACINMGGNIVVFGGKPDGSAWSIGVRDPHGTAEQSEEVLALMDGAVVTSGNYERFFDLNGVRYHHILDPKTGMPVQNGLASVTIRCEQSTLADALSTACYVLGPDRCKDLLKRYGASAIFLHENGDRTEIS